MEGFDLTQLGISGVTLAIIFFIVRWFVQTISMLIENSAKIADKFNTTISNHINHATKAQEQLAEQMVHMRGSLDSNTRVISKLYKVLYNDKNRKG